jgi:hypothetical protein
MFMQKQATSIFRRLNGFNTFNLNLPHSTQAQRAVFNSLLVLEHVNEVLSQADKCKVLLEPLMNDCVPSELST